MAYLIENFGQNLAFPNVSPNKTFEGSFGGLISSIISSCIIFRFWYQYRLSENDFYRTYNIYNGNIW